MSCPKRSLNKVLSSIRKKLNVYCKNAIIRIEIHVYVYLLKKFIIIIYKYNNHYERFQYCVFAFKTLKIYHKFNKKCSI